MGKIGKLDWHPFPVIKANLKTIPTYKDGMKKKEDKKLEMDVNASESSCRPRCHKIGTKCMK
jgi:hypothetical protein